MMFLGLFLFLFNFNFSTERAVPDVDSLPFLSLTTKSSPKLTILIPHDYPKSSLVVEVKGGSPCFSESFFRKYEEMCSMYKDMEHVCQVLAEFLTPSPEVEESEDEADRIDDVVCQQQQVNMRVENI